MESVRLEQAARGIGESLREAAAKSLTVEHLAAEAERLRRVVAISQPTPRQRLPLKALLAAACACAFVLVGTFMYVSRSSSQRPLTVELQSVEPLSGKGRTDATAGARSVRLSEHAVITSDSGNSRLLFSDGSRVTVASGTRLRLAALMNQGATLLLEKGQADVAVVHRNASTSWSVAAGPFTIAVTGTRFGVAWDPARERLVVELREGSVEVSSPRFASPAALKAGERLEAFSGDRHWRIVPLGSTEIAGEPPAAPPVAAASADPTGDERLGAPEASSHGLSATSAAGAVRSSSETVRQAIVAKDGATPFLPSVSSGARPTEARQWAKLVASGEFRQVTREADAMGLMVCLAQCSASDLRALADASRYTGRLDTAEAALRELYTRFPGQASTATYLLGAVDEARGRSESALRWYTEYLARVSSGGVVAEAKAARMRMLVATGGKAAAERAAREYLDSYPKGPAAGLARKVLEGR